MLHRRALRDTYDQIAVRLGTPHTADTVRKRLLALKTRGMIDATMAQGVLSGDAPRSESSVNLGDLAPIVIPEPVPPPRVDGKATRLAVISNDHHWPLADPHAEDVLLQVLEHHQPDQYIMNGDGPDLGSISKYAHDLMDERWSLQDERVSMQKFLHEIHRILPVDTKLFETNANHSGNGVESRWRRYLSDRVPVLGSLPDLQELIGYQKVFHPPWSRFEVVDTVEITPGLVVLHGDVVRRKAGNSAIGMLEKWRVSLIHGHTHRMGHTAMTIPALHGREATYLQAYEGGCMCKLEPKYMKGADWQQGFTAVEYDNKGFNVTPVYIHRGVAYFGGRRYRSRLLAPEA